MVKRVKCANALFLLAAAALALTAVFVQEAAAAETAEAPKSLFDFYIAGGKLMWVILGCSLVALAVIMERVFSLRRKKVLDDQLHGEIIDLVKTEGAERALERVQESSLPMSKVLAAVLRCAERPQAEMGTMLEDAGARELSDLRRNAKPLGVISGVAPLVGLLGTVLGIIRAFSDIATQEGAVGNPKMLATGIYEALITTAAGLSVAIPALLFYHFFQDRADAFVRDIEEKALEMIGTIVQVRSARGGAKPASADAGSDA